MPVPSRSTPAPAPRVAVAPTSRPAMHAAFVAAVEEGGGDVVALAEAEVLVWADPGAAPTFPSVIAQAPAVGWIQLPYAGVEPFESYLDHRYRWTCGKGVYATPVAEQALTLTLAGLRRLDTYTRATTWREPLGRNLIGGRLTVLGGGGICTELLRLLAPFDVGITVVRRHPEPMTGAQRVVSPLALHEAVSDADAVIVALALTPETTGIVNAAVLSDMASHAWLVNVGRGGHVVTSDLVDALRQHGIAGAALDVTDPEPLPDDHPLWSLSNCIITPHVGNTPAMGLPLISRRVRDNVGRYARGEPLIGTVDVELGY